MAWMRIGSAPSATKHRQWWPEEGLQQELDRPDRTAAVNVHHGQRTNALGLQSGRPRMAGLWLNQALQCQAARCIPGSPGIPAACQARPLSVESQRFHRIAWIAMCSSGRGLWRCLSSLLPHRRPPAPEKVNRKARQPLDAGRAEHPDPDAVATPRSHAHPPPCNEVVTSRRSGAAAAGPAPLRLGSKALLRLGPGTSTERFTFLNKTCHDFENARR